MSKKDKEQKPEGISARDRDVVEMVEDTLDALDALTAKGRTNNESRARRALEDARRCLLRGRG